MGINVVLFIIEWDAATYKGEKWSSRNKPVCCEFILRDIIHFEEWARALSLEAGRAKKLGELKR